MINPIFYIDDTDAYCWHDNTGTDLLPGWYFKTWGDMFGPQPSYFHWTHFYLPFLQNCDTTFTGRFKINLMNGVMDYA